jgi:hypothetical protein
MKYFDNVGQTTATTGQGDVTLGAVLGTNFFTFAEQGAQDGDPVYIRIDEAGDVEIARATLNITAGTLSRDAVLRSRIGGVAGTAKMNLGGAAQVRCIAPSEALSLLAAGRNRVVNPCMQHSQENGNSAGTQDGYHAADQWEAVHSHDGAVSFERVASVTPAGAHYRLRLSVTSADTSIAADQYQLIRQKLEASRMRDFLFGSADARPGVIRLGLKAPAGTYGIAIVNAAVSRSFVAEVTIEAGEANTDVVKTVAFAGDITGTWETGDVLGWILSICIAAGNTYLGSAGWQSGYYLAGVGQTNGLASNSNVFEIFDVGLRLDPDGAGAYGQFEVSDDYPELLLCQRYWRRAGKGAIGAATSSSAASFGGPIGHPRMRTTPTASFIAGQGSDLAINTGGTAFTFTGSDSVGANDGRFFARRSGTSGLTAGQWLLGNTDFVALNARM